MPDAALVEAIRSPDGGHGRRSQELTPSGRGSGLICRSIGCVMRTPAIASTGALPFIWSSRRSGTPRWPPRAAPCTPVPPTARPAISASEPREGEIERDHLESWSGPAEVKGHLLAELEQCHRANRERFTLQLERLRQGRGLEPATPRRTDH